LCGNSDLLGIIVAIIRTYLISCQHVPTTVVFILLNSVNVPSFCICSQTSCKADKTSYKQLIIHHDDIVFLLVFILGGFEILYNVHFLLFFFIATWCFKVIHCVWKNIPNVIDCQLNKGYLIVIIFMRESRMLRASCVLAIILASVRLSHA